MSRVGAFVPSGWRFIEESDDVRYLIGSVVVNKFFDKEKLVLLTTRDEVTADAVREKLAAAGVPNLWIPKIVKRVEAIPVLGTGKLDLKAAKALATG